MLAPGDYNLVKKKPSCDNKSLLFVKLTDSAYRAINEYLNNRDKCKFTPTIHFSNNNGCIRIPSSYVKCGGESFNFKVSTGMEGQQGLFECVMQKSGRKKLNKFGHLTQRLSIQANEDIYEKTKRRMAAVDQEQKRNCTVQIDWNLFPQNKMKPNTNKNYKGSGTNFSISPSHPHNNANSKQKIISNPYLMRRPLRERLIHMLAVRPYKKLELYDVLNREGIRDIDKSNLMSTLMSVSSSRYNTYYLLRHIWNDVQEDWSFYTEQELQQMKRNKPQNLTPPGSDSGISVGSNQSPCSSQMPDKSPSYQQYKRPGYVSNADGSQTKRYRISHYVKPGIVHKGKELQQQHQQQLGHSNWGGRNAFISNGSPNNSDNAIPLSPRLTLEQPPSCFDELIAATSVSKNSTKWSQNYSPFRPSEDVGKSSKRNNLQNPSHCDKLGSSSTLDRRMEKIDSNDSNYGNNPDYQSEGTMPTYDTLGISDNDTSLSLNDEPSAVISASPTPMPPPSEKQPKPKYLWDYVKITDFDQRRKYKQDFATNFKEYQILRKKMDNVTASFKALGDLLTQKPVGSEDRRAVEMNIIKKYNDVKNDARFQSAKKRFEYLHEKLSHIKNLVTEFDHVVFYQNQTNYEPHGMYQYDNEDTDNDDYVTF